MSAAREEILSRVRAALADVPAGEPAAVPRGYRTETDDDLATFLDRLAHVDAEVARVADEPDAIAAAVAEALARHGARRVVVPDGVPEDWVGDGIEALRDDPPLAAEALDAADGVLTACALAVAQTGTIVLDGGPGMGRRALSLVPDLHVCVVRAAQIVASVPEALAALDPVRPLTLLTGPSATVDIEMVRVSGVHGPRRLCVILAKS